MLRYSSCLVNVGIEISYISVAWLLYSCDGERSCAAPFCGESHIGYWDFILYWITTKGIVPKIDCDKTFFQSVVSRLQIPELERAYEPNGNWGEAEHDPRGSPRSLRVACLAGGIRELKQLRLQKTNRFNDQSNSSALASRFLVACEQAPCLGKKNSKFPARPKACWQARFLVHFFDVHCTTTTWNS